MPVGAQWAVNLEALGKSYPGGWSFRSDHPAVIDLTLRLAPGQVLGLLGPNGSGKSTTIKALAGLIAPTAGRCEILGHKAGSDAARAVVGYLPESPRFAENFTARALLVYLAELGALPRERVALRVDAVLAWVELMAVADRKIATFSKGMRQRLGLAQAIVHEPRVVLLDEPASGLDHAGRAELGRLLRTLADSGTTVVFSSHLVAQAATVCDRIALLGRGRLLIEGTPDELLGAAAHEAVALTPLEKLYQEKLHAHG